MSPAFNAGLAFAGLGLAFAGLAERFAVLHSLVAGSGYTSTRVTQVNEIVGRRRLALHDQVTPRAALVRRSLAGVAVS